jgi:hydroxypyruvate reductase
MRQEPPDLQNLRRAALEIFSAALKEMDAGAVLRARVQLDGSRFKIFDTVYNLETESAPVYAISIGKAALSMAAALDGILESRLTKGIVAAPSQVEAKLDALLQQLISVGQMSAEEAGTEMCRGVVRRAVEQSEQRDSQNSSPLSSRWNFFGAGHPLPNQGSLDAARAAISLLRRADRERALVVFLISGGGSATFELPRDERITLEDLREANRMLVSCGATIAEINSVRRAFSAVKGGRLSAFVPHASQLSLIVSDTNPGEESTVASGPTFQPPEDAPEAREVISRYQLEGSLPSAVLRAVNDAATEVRIYSGAVIDHYLLLDNCSAIEAAASAAHARGFVVAVAPDIIEQPIGTGCTELLSQLYAGKTGNPDEVFCLISGGEFVCPVRGDGTGGRNAETALRCALDLNERRHAVKNKREMHTVILSAGTDGIDGNSPAAGAIADEATIERALALALDARGSLERSDAYTFFHALGDAIVTGPTGTNVRDLRIMIAH